MERHHRTVSPERLLEISKAYKSGMLADDMAKAFGYQSTLAMHVFITRQRKKYPDLFPLRGRDKQKHLREYLKETEPVDD